MDHIIGPVLPMALRNNAIISTPPVSPGEKVMPPPKEMCSFPNNTPNTIPIAIGKKSVSDKRFTSFPNKRATAWIPSFSPTTISLSPNFSASSGEGDKSIPLRRTRVTVQPKFFCRFSSPNCLLIISFLVSNKDSMVCVWLNGSSPSSRSPNINAKLFNAFSLPTAWMQSPSCNTVCALGIRISSPCFKREITAPVMARMFNWLNVRPNTAGFVTRNKQVLSSGNWLRRSFSSLCASSFKSTPISLGSNFTKRITPITPNG